MKFGTIGTSWITKMYIDAAISGGRWEYVHTYSRDIGKAEEFVKPYDNVSCFDDLEAFAQGLDAVYIASPNMLHAGQAEFFLKRKIHVICEKPIAANYSQFKKLVTLADENNAYVFEALMHIQKPGFAAIKSNVHKLGRLRQVNLNFNQYSSRYDKFKQGEVSNIFSRRFAGGALMDLGIYPLSFCAALFGEPKDSLYRPIKLENGIDGCGTLLLDYGDFLATMTCSKITVGGIGNEIIGESGRISFGHITALKDILLSCGGEDMLLPVPDEANGMVYEAENFFDIIQNKDEARFRELLAISEINMKTLDKSRMQGGIFWEGLEDGYAEKAFEPGAGQQG